MKLDLQNRSPEVLRLPDTRLRVTRTYDVLNFVPKTGASLIADVWLAWGTQDTVFTGVRLIKQDVSGQSGLSRGPNEEPPKLVRIFEEIPESAEIQVGNNEVIQLKDGRIGIKAEFLQFSSATATPGTVNVTTAPGVATSFMTGEDAPNDGTLRRITRTYETAGVISQTDETKNNGALLLRTIVSVHTAPATPAGYILIFTKQDEINGFPTDTYTFAKGLGQISQTDETKYDGGLLIRTIKYLAAPSSSNPIATPADYTAVDISYEDADGYRIWSGVFACGKVSTGAGGVISTNIEYEISPDVGVTGITRQTIKYISDPTVVANPISAPGGYVLISIENSKQDGWILWTGMYATGTGVIESSTDIRENGKLVLYKKRSLNAIPSTPSPTIGGTVVLIDSGVANGTRVENGCLVYDYGWAEGNGQVATHITTRQDGLREVTFISLGTRIAPTGAIIRDDVQSETGYDLYTVSTMQTAAGGTGITGVSFTFGSIEKWTYPGRLKPFVAITGAFKALDVYKSPPITTDIAASILITYQTSGTLTPANTLWSPTDAAAMYSQWVGTNGQQHNLVESYPGYRYVSGGTSSLTATDNIHFSIFNQPIINGNTAAISATGGPVAPDGNTYCLRAHLEPAFIDTSGTIYYRKTEVFATIPVQTALPV